MHEGSMSGSIPPTANARGKRGQRSDHALSNTVAAVSLEPTLAEGEIGRPTLTAGDTLGRYRILETVGMGGMGVVYSAHDQDLQRTVALKLLHTSSGTNSSRSNAERNRLLREARAMARLARHPNVIQVYDVATDGHHDFVAMEYVDGTSLDQWLKREQHGWREVLDAFIKAAHGLMAAHDADVVHRDFKPANVLMQTDGRVLVTDFGLARVPAGTAPTPETDEADDDETDHDRPPADTSMTRTGAIMGTPAYMAPEQHRSDTIDARTDQYSFCVALYEGIFGRRPFTGESLQALARSKTEEGLPDPGAHGEAAVDGVGQRVPAHIYRTLRQGTSADPDDRFPSMQDLLVALCPHQRPPARRLLWLGLGLGLTVAAAIAVYAWRAADPNDADQTAAPATPQVGKTARLTAAVGMELEPALSPDGRTLAYVAELDGRMQLHARDMETGQERPMATDIAGDHHWPMWSNDGRDIAILAERVVHLVPAGGGPVRPLIARPLAEQVFGVALSPDGQHLAYSTQDAVHLLPLAGGPARELVRTYEPHSMSFSSDGTRLAYVSGNPQFVIQSPVFPNIAPSAIWIVAVTDGRPSRLTSDEHLDMSPVWSNDDRLLLFVSNRDGNRDIHHVPVPRQAGRGDTPVPQPSRLTTGLRAHSVSMAQNTGQLAYSSLTMRANIWSLATGAGPLPSLNRATPVTRGNQQIESMGISPDGRWLAFDSNYRGSSQDIYLMSLESGEIRQLTSDPADDFAPDWSPDGQFVAFHSFRDGNRELYVAPIDGGPPERLTSTPETQELVPDWSPDGQSLVFFGSRGGELELYRSTRDPEGRFGAPQQLTEDGGVYPRWSPDGRHIAYISGRHPGAAGRHLPEPVRISLLSADGRPVRDLLELGPGLVRAPLPFYLRWASDGSAVYYIAYESDGTTGFWSVPASGGTPVRLTQPYQQLLRVDFEVAGTDLYFTLKEHDSDIWSMELSSATR